jgi:hypothetical protein
VPVVKGPTPESTAEPELIVAEPSLVEPSKKLTVPVGAGEPVPATAAARFTKLDGTTDVAEDVRVVVVVKPMTTLKVVVTTSAPVVMVRVRAPSAAVGAMTRFSVRAPVPETVGVLVVTPVPEMDAVVVPETNEVFAPATVAATVVPGIPETGDKVIDGWPFTIKIPRGTVGVDCTLDKTDADRLWMPVKSLLNVRPKVRAF